MTYHYAEIPGQAGGDLIFVFHGTGGDEHQFTGLARDMLPNCHVIAPRGDVSENGALRYFRRTAEGVYDMEDLVQRTQAMTAFVQAHVARLAPSRVLGLGYSNGANILASVLFGPKRLFDKAVLLHPLIPFDPAPHADLGGTRVLITAGKRDPICPPLLTERLAHNLTAGGSVVELDWHDGGHELHQEEVIAAQVFLAG
jgi:phospholipase/carboxylesterase